jgi:hypothetical protein
VAFLAVCMLLGVLFIVSALLDWEWIYGFWDLEAIRAVFGEGTARLACGIGGIVIFVTAAGYWLGK